MSIGLLLLAPALAAPNPVRFEMDQDLVLDGPIDDVFGLGQRVATRGVVDDNALLVAEERVVDSPVRGDRFSMAQEVRIRAPIAGDVYVVGGDVALEPQGSIAGHLHTLGGDVRIEGPVGGDVVVRAGVLQISAPVAGDVHADVGELVVTRDAAIGGNLTYVAPSSLDGLEPQVAGEVEFLESGEPRAAEPPLPPIPPIPPLPPLPPLPPGLEELEELDRLAELEEEPGFVSGVMSWGFWRTWSWSSRLMVGGLLLVLGGKGAGRVARTLVAQPSKSLGIGFVGATSLLFCSLFALVTIVGFPVGVVGLALLGLALYVTQLVAAQALGDLLLKRFRPEAWGSPFLSMAIGLVPLVLLYPLPWVGWAAWLLATMAGLGATWLHLRGGASPS